MKRIYTLLVLLFCVLQINAQHHKHKEKIKAMKVAYITTELDLTTKEAEKFWPVFNEFDEKMHQLHVERRKSRYKRAKEAGGIDNMSEKEASSLLAEKINSEFEIAKTQQELVEKLRKIISSKKILKLFKAEHDFNKQLLRDFRNKRKNKR